MNMFFKKANTIGLFKANLNTYKIALSRGMSKEEAVIVMVETRYPERDTSKAFDDILRTCHLIQGNNPKLMDRFSEPDADVKLFILALMIYEHCLSVYDQSEGLLNQYAMQIESTYNKIF